MTVKNCQILASQEVPDRNKYDAVLLTLPAIKDPKWDEFTAVDQDIRDGIKVVYERTKCKGKAGDQLVFDLNPSLRVAVLFEGFPRSPFQYLQDSRSLISKVMEAGGEKILVDLRYANEPGSLLDYLTSAMTTHDYKFRKYGEKKNSEKNIVWHVIADGPDLTETLVHARETAESTNMVRDLSQRAGNDLTPKTYVEYVKELSGTWGVDFEFYDYEKLLELGAGAFIAVAQGSPEHDAGVVKLSYNPKSQGKHVTLVGKGITYDTGGTNLKPARSMFGMQGDMGGSALALATLRLAVAESWDYKVTCYLAISDNSIGSKAYRPNDVVTALNGKSIEVVHTDAEGRMVLADTLHLASQEKADLLLDFATLTGACVGAIGTAYSGAFTNRNHLHSVIVNAGIATGERVWTFPLDDDFGECLKSDIADIKQCRLSGGVDHIEAAYFLKEFVDKEVPWIHIDLASSENSGGLAHVSSDCTGYGIRLVSKIISDVLG